MRIPPLIFNHKKHITCLLVLLFGIVPLILQSQNEHVVNIYNHISGDPEIAFEVKITNYPEAMARSGEKLVQAEFRVNFLEWTSFPIPDFPWERSDDINSNLWDYRLSGTAIVTDVENTIEVRIRFQGQDMIVGSGKLRYAAPEAYIMLDEFQFAKNAIFVTTKADTTLLVRVKPAFISDSIPDGTDQIFAVNYSINESPRLTINTSHTNETREIPLDLNQNSYFKAGHNSIKLWAEGNYGDNEISNIVELDLILLIFDESLDQITNIQTPGFQLDAYPPGGWYEGPGILSMTPWFDPAEAGVGTHPIRYTIPIDGKNYSIEKYLEVSAVRSIYIDGEKSVCSNSINQYTITPHNPEAVYLWTIEGGKASSSDKDTCTITWKENGSGTIRVEIHATDTIVIEERIYISCKQALDSPEIFWGDNNFQLLVCSEYNAKGYKWYKNDQEIELTLTNYIFLNSFYQGTVDDQFYVEIESLDGCTTQSESINCSKAYINEKYFFDGSSFNAKTAYDSYTHTITIEIFENINTPLSIEVLDLFGRKVIQKSLEANGDGHKIERISAAGLSSGIYVISINSNSQKMFRSKLFIN